MNYWHRFAIPKKSSDFKDAPPTSAPSTSSKAKISLALFGLTEPP